MSKTIETKTQTITPTQCMTWLEKNEHNRPLQSKHISTLARTMIRGDWVVNGESLKFDTKGNVLDGQHRMWACIEANTPFRTFVTTNLPTKTFDTIDTGQTRKSSDILAINKEANVVILAGVLKHILRYTTKQMRSTLRYTNREVEEALKQNPDVREYVKYCSTHRVRWCSSIILAFSWYITAQNHKEKADEFFTSLIQGTNLKPDSIILVVRNKFIDVSSNPLIRLDAFRRIELIVRAWNLYLKGKTQKSFKIGSFSNTSEDFPEFN